MLFILLLFSVIYAVLYCMEMHSKNLRLEKRNKYLKRALSKAEEDIYKKNFRLPEADDV